MISVISCSDDRAIDAIENSVRVMSVTTGHELLCPTAGHGGYWPRTALIRTIAATLLPELREGLVSS